MKKKHCTDYSTYLRKILYAYALYLTCGNKHLANNLLSETFTRISQRATAYQQVVSFETWAKMVMKTAFHETVADAKKREFYNLLCYGILNPMFPEWKRRLCLREQLRIMSHLTPQQAAVATLLLGGYDLKVIAAEMGTTVECVNSHLTATRQTLIGVLGN